MEKDRTGSNEECRKENEDDVRAIYRYLRSLDPVDRDNRPVVRGKTD